MECLLKVLIATSKLVSKLFEPKFASARTKCESVIVKCTAPIHYATKNILCRGSNVFWIIFVR